MKFLLLLIVALTAADDIKWNVTENNTTCVLLEASSITSTLHIVDDQNKTETITFSINKTITVDGDCDPAANHLHVTFFPDGKTPTSATSAQPWELKFTFKADGDIAFKLFDYSLVTAPSEFFNTTTQTYTMSNTSEVDVEAQQKNGFKCSTTGLALTDDSTIELKGLRVIAQARLSTPEFPKEQVFEQCMLDTRTSDIVPVVVGACLAGLVVVVLVAYLIGRARAKRQGYASV